MECIEDPAKLIAIFSEPEPVCCFLSLSLSLTHTHTHVLIDFNV